MGLCEKDIRLLPLSQERPYLSLRLKLDHTLVGSVMVEAGHFSPHSHTDVRASSVSPLDAGCWTPLCSSSGSWTPLRIDDIARELDMSASSFHHHFRAVTAMSLLQFQKRMRLQEARRLMLGEGLDAAGAGY